MAEGRRREDEEEELRERREFGGPRRARGRALSGHSAAGEGRGEREGVRARRGPRAGRPGAAPLLPGTAAAPSPVRLGPASSTLRGETQGEWLFHPHPHSRAEPPGNPNWCLPASGPGAETTEVSCALNPGAAGLNLVARVITYLQMSQRPVQDSLGLAVSGDDPSRWVCLPGRYQVEPRAESQVWLRVS